MAFNFATWKNDNIQYYMTNDCSLGEMHWVSYAKISVSCPVYEYISLILYKVILG